MRKYWLGLLCLVATTALGASSFTTHYTLEKSGDGDTNWGDGYRDNLDTIDSQMFINSSGISDHLTDPTAAHAATAISAASGALTCTTSINVQTYLDCLDSQIGSIVGGAVVLLATDQTITGQKTFSQAILATGGVTGNVTGSISGNVTGNLTGNVTGNVTGAVTGNVTGNLTGNVTGIHTGNVTGNVTGNLTGAVTGNVTGNLTGNVTGNVSGATGVFTTSVTTPTIVNTGTLTLPTSTDTLVGKATNDVFTNKSISGATNTLTAIPLTTAVTGLLPLANGGTNKLATASAGAVAYSDSDSFEFTAVGSSGQIFQSAGTGTPVWSTATYPATAGSSGNVIVSGGTNFTATTLNLASSNAVGTSILPVANGGTNLSAGTSGGILGYTATGTLASSALLATSQVVIGGGAGATPTTLAIGTAGKVLRSDGTTPTYAYPVVNAQTSTYAAVANDNVITGATSGGAFTVTLPTAVGISGKTFKVCKADSSANLLTVATTSSQTLGPSGPTSIKIDLIGECDEFISDGANWIISEPWRQRSALLNCDSGSAITSQQGAWFSAVANISGGSCALTFVTGIFSAQPYCWAIDTQFAAVPKIVAARATSTTAGNIGAANDAGTNSVLIDGNFTCIGPK